MAKQLEITRQEAYRALVELQEKGIVEKIVASPVKYSAISLPELLSSITNQKTQEYQNLMRRVEQLSSKNREVKQDIYQDYKISVLSGRNIIVNKCKSAHASVQKIACCCSTYPRWIQNVQEINEVIKQALCRGVEYRWLIEKPEYNVKLPKDLEFLIYDKNSHVKMTTKHLCTNAVIFDRKFGWFTYYPSESIAETPLIWTNHPSILDGLQELFDKLWKRIK